jgi:3-deoxy-manno-octulosonate cytidylyltransferase (CMP-KDO synthetase)
MTSAAHRSGTDRLAEAARRWEAEIVVNIQGDEPLLDPAAVDALVREMVKQHDIPMGSLMCPLAGEHEELDPAVVKVVTDMQGHALYFSRSAIPYLRNTGAAIVKKHIGIYAYRWHFLLTFAALEQTTLEKTESLEQLRALENGYRIAMVETEFSPTSVDTPADLAKVREVLARR